MSTSQVALLASVQQFLDRQHGLYLDGAQQAAESEKRLTVWNPATGQAIASTADANAADVDRAVMSAGRALSGVDQKRADWRRGRDRAVELSADDLYVESDARAGGWLLYCY